MPKRGSNWPPAARSWKPSGQRFSRGKLHWKQSVGNGKRIDNEWTVRRAAEAEQLAARQTEFEARRVGAGRSSTGRGNCRRPSRRPIWPPARLNLRPCKQQVALKLPKPWKAERLAARQAELDTQRQALEEQQAAWETQKTETAERHARTRPNCSGFCGSRIRANRLGRRTSPVGVAAG